MVFTLPLTVAVISIRIANNVTSPLHLFAFCSQEEPMIVHRDGRLCCREFGSSEAINKVTLLATGYSFPGQLLPDFHQDFS